jgi:hypothetical protein
MKPYVKNFEDRLAGIFEKKAAEFARYSEEQPATAIVTRQLADLYKDLLALMRR